MITCFCASFVQESMDAVTDEICSLQDDISRLIDAHSMSDEFGGGMPETHDLWARSGRKTRKDQDAKGLINSFCSEEKVHGASR